jgi:hypothetical protein
MRHLVFISILFLNSAYLIAQKSNTESGINVLKNRTFFNLEKYWDADKVCKNPHKGWELHYFDNGLNKYGNRLATNDFLLDFPGLKNIYLRLAWAYLEPEEGQFNWLVIDSVINKWTAKGYDISFRITCKETHDLIYATPEWVRKEGANGRMVQNNNTPNPQWEPDYGDSIFLEKLDNFHKAFAARYDGKPWVSFVDIGSIGEWGEGHTAYSGWYDVPVAAIKKHIEIYKKYYKKSTLIISDDFIAHRASDDGSDDELLDFIIQNNIGFRDDSFGVGWNINRGFGYSTITNPELFNLVWKNIPVVLESDHYRAAGKPEIWENGKRFEVAIRETHATFISFHHWPREWLIENSRIAEKFANLCGYWYFPKYAVLPDTLRKGGNRNYLKLTWENHGTAPAYHKYSLRFKLLNKITGEPDYLILKESNNLNWMPGCIVGEKYQLNLSQNIKNGKYDILIGLFDGSSGEIQSIDLGIKNERKDNEGYFKLGEINVSK